jgi:hypothetical protein
VQLKVVSARRATRLVIKRQFFIYLSFYDW